MQLGSRWWLLKETGVSQATMRDHLWLSAILLIILVSGVYACIHFTFTRRLRWLTAEAERIQAGDAPRPPLPGTDAISHLSRSMSRTASQWADLRRATDEHAIVAITDRKGVITFVNDKFCAISGYAREELTGKTHRIINSGSHPKEFFQDMWRTISAGNIWSGEVENRAKGGNHYFVATTIVPCPGPDGKPARYIAIRTDVTEQKGVAKRLRALTTELEGKNSDLEMLLHAASHDLRSPLVNVQGFASMIGEQSDAMRALLLSAVDGHPPTRDEAESLTAETTEAVRFICAGAEKMDGLLKGLLMFSRLGRSAPSLQPVDIGELIKNSLDAMRFQIDASGARVSTADLPSCWADPQLLDHVVSNLLDNSIKYRDTRRPLEIRIAASTEGKRCLYRFSDNGIGIAPEHREKVFDLFHRLDPKRNTGHGLGLAIVKRALDRMNGSVAVGAAPDGGAEFVISLKLAPPRLTASSVV